ncbi:MAG: adenosylcobinamide-GDP ribazoletransferase [Cohaesibacter sp.]|nr:adenosylcobinamide-GDP ribazoletransferase [Cohaesibacter sp.]
MSESNKPEEPQSQIFAKRVHGDLRLFLQDFRDCLSFFSRIPVTSILGPVSDGLPEFERASRHLPLVGLLLGLLSLVPATLFDAIALTAPLPSMLLAGLTLATMALLTGGLHEDGLADMADGFGGGYTIERKIEIMKDSRLGSYGALTLLFSVLIRFGILSYLFAHYGVWTAGIAFLASSMVSRVPMLHVWYMLPAARLNGLSSVAGQPTARSYGIGVGIAALVTGCLIVPYFGFAAALSAFIFVALASGYMVWLSKRHIRGQTGDVLGGSQQIGEIAFGVGLLLLASAG